MSEQEGEALIVNSNNRPPSPATTTTKGSLPRILEGQDFRFHPPTGFPSEWRSLGLPAPRRLPPISTRDATTGGAAVAHRRGGGAQANTEPRRAHQQQQNLINVVVVVASHNRPPCNKWWRRIDRALPFDPSIKECFELTTHRPLSHDHLERSEERKGKKE